MVSSTAQLAFVIVIIYGSCGLLLATTEEDLNDFWKWCQERNIFPGNSPQYAVRNLGGIGQGFGVTAERKIGAGELLFIVPNGSYIDSANLENIPEQPFPSPPVEIHPWIPYFSIAAWLLRERALGKQSEWEPYIRLLPKKVAIPLFYSNELLAEFQSEEIVRVVHSDIHILKLAYSEVVPRHIANSSFAEFKWAVGVVVSRAFASQKASHATLVPLADFLNHKEPPQTHWNYTKDGFYMETDRSVEAGEQLWNSYGPISNRDLLLHYGFVVESNPFNSLTLFSGVHEVVGFYTEHVANSNFTELELQWLTHVAEKIVYELDQWNHAEIEQSFGTKELHDFFGPEWNHMEGSGYAVWPDSRVEPRIIAAMAAMAHFEAYRTEPKDYSLLAMQCLKAGRNHPVDWEAPDFPDEFVMALNKAVIGLYKKISYTVHDFPSTLEIDASLLAECSGLKSAAENIPSMCSSLWVQYPDEMKLALLYRVSVKKLLENVVKRVWNDWELVRASVEAAINTPSHEEL